MVPFPGFVARPTLTQPEGARDKRPGIWEWQCDDDEGCRQGVWMFSFRAVKTETIEAVDPSTERFEPAHPSYYKGQPGNQIQRLMTARQDFLSVWKKKDYSVGIADIKLFGRQVVVV